MAELFLIVGLPGAGKPTRARELAATHHAVRFSPDDRLGTVDNQPVADLPPNP